MNMSELSSYYTAKLAHYNAWLGDSTRELGTFYPGFPDEITLVQEAVEPAVEAPIARAKKAAPKTVKTPGKGTKLEQAKALFKANPEMTRAEIIALFQAELGMSKAGATTYFYSAQK